MEQSRAVWILIFIVAAMAIITLGMLLVLGIYLYLTPQAVETTPPQYAPAPVIPEPAEPIDEGITSERVRAIAEKMEGIEGINPGAKFGLYIEGGGNYTVGQTEEGIMVVEGGQEYTDIDLFLDSMESFEAVEDADDVCAKIRELRNAGNITYETHISEMQMYFKGYLSLAPCLE